MLSDHFSLDEFTASQEATRHGINNKPSEKVVENLRMLAALLEQVRELLGGGAIRISSGFRSLALNRHIKSSDSSAHVRGWAADFTCPSFGTPLAVAKKIAESNLKFDQLICEGIDQNLPDGKWLHISCDPKNRRDVLSATFKGGKAFYNKGLPE
jgi:zinc D-Ala-D-Ala carboxypeptidase